MPRRKTDNRNRPKMTDDELADKNLKMALVSHKYAQGCNGKDGGRNGRYKKDTNETCKEKNTISKMKNTLTELIVN